MNELALFAGAGGGLLASRLLGWRTVCAVEINEYCQRVLLQRQRDRVFEPFPIWDDVRTFNGTKWCGKVDVIAAGFPCQPFSAAGKQLGADDPRNMWPSTARILGEVRPRYALLENVPAIITSGYFGAILGDLAAIGYDCRWGVFSAAASGAPHMRRRLFIFCTDADSARKLQSQRSKQDIGQRAGDMGENVSVANKKGLPKRERENTKRKRANSRTEPKQIDWWGTEPAMGRVAHGVANRSHRLKATGNGQVPAMVVRAWRELTEDLFYDED